MTQPPRAHLTFFALVFYAIASLIAMATMSIGAAVLFAGILADGGGRGRGPRGLGAELRSALGSGIGRAYLIASALLIAAWILSLASATFFPLHYGPDAPAVHWPGDLAKIWYFALPPALAVAWRRLSQARRSRVIGAWLIAFGLLSLVGIPQFFTGWPRQQPNPLLPGYFHPILFLGHHLSVASIWPFPFFAALDALTLPRLRRHLRIPASVLVASLLAGGVTMVLGYSRTLWVALPLGLALWAILRLRARTAVGIAVGLFATCAALSQTSFFNRRFESALGVGDRLMLWRANFEFFLQRPLFGVGFGKNQEMSLYYQRSLHPGLGDYFVGHAHDIFLEVLAGTGLFGLLAWFAWNGVVILALIRARRRGTMPLFWAGALCAWSTLLLNGVTQVNFYEGKVMHQIMWIAGLALFWNAPASSERLAGGEQLG